MGISKDLTESWNTSLAADLKESTPIQKNIDYFINAQKSLVISYEDEQKSYIKEKINEIQNDATNKKISNALKTINTIGGRKKSNKLRIKAKDDNERVKLWHNHFKELLGKNTQTINENEQEWEIINGLDINTEPFTLEDLSKATSNISYEKAVGLDKYQLKYEN